MRTDDIETSDAISLLSRRRFLQGIGASTAGLAMANTLSLGDVASAAPLGPDDGVLVVVVLAGGNDGLNTVVPAGIGSYYDRRKAISIPATSTLPIGGGFGLHPSLTYMKNLYDSGMVAVVDGVGVTTATSFSHFDSMAYWMKGNTTSGPATGWIGRYLDSIGGSATSAGHIGHNVPLMMIGNQSAGSAIPLWSFVFGRSAELVDRQLNDAIRAMGGSTGLGTWGDQIAKSQIEALDVAGHIQPLHSPPLPDGDFIKEMNLAARVINANFGMRVLSVMRGDFDHHSDQLDDHAALLRDLDQGLQSFYSTLTPANANRTTIMIVSEFGRTPDSNDGRGTDHGSANAVFLLGNRVAGGRYGQLPSFTNLDEHRRFKPTVDFRQVYATVLDSWLQADSGAVLGGSFGSLPLFKGAPSVQPVPPAPPTPAGRYVAITPSRILDTRNGTGAARAPVVGGAALPLVVSGVGGIPPADVTSVVMNVTVTEPTLAGYVTVYPTGEPRPVASHLNFTANQTVPNLVLSKMGTGGMVTLFANAGRTHLVADVVGYFSTKGGSTLVPLTPTRLIDTR